MSFMVLLAAGSCYLCVEKLVGQHPNAVFWISFITLFVGILCVGFLSDSTPTKATIRYIAWTGTAIAFGGMISGMISFFAAVNPESIFVAFILSVAVFFCLSIVALISKRRSFLFLGSFLSFALLGMLLYCIVRKFVPSLAKSMETFHLWFGLAIFMLYVLYDTQVLIEMSEKGYKNLLMDSLSLFLDLANIFLRILMLMNNSRRR